MTTTALAVSRLKILLSHLKKRGSVKKERSQQRSKAKSQRTQRCADNTLPSFSSIKRRLRIYLSYLNSRANTNFQVTTLRERRRQSSLLAKAPRSLLQMRRT